MSKHCKYYKILEEIAAGDMEIGNVSKPWKAETAQEMAKDALKQKSGNNCTYSESIAVDALKRIAEAHYGTLAAIAKKALRDIQQRVL